MSKERKPININQPPKEDNSMEKYEDFVEELTKEFPDLKKPDSIVLFDEEDRSEYHKPDKPKDPEDTV